MISIKTDVLRNMLNRIQKGLGNSRIIPVTGMLNIKVENNLLTIVATSIDTFIEIVENIRSEKNFNVVVDSNTLIKLISTISVGVVMFDVNENALDVVGNGQYRLPLIDITYPTFNFGDNFIEYQLKTTELQTTLNINKTAVAVNTVMPCLAGYYIDNDRIVTTDGVKMCIINKQYVDEPLLLSQKIVDLIDIISEEDIIMRICGGAINIKSNTINIYATEMDNKEDYPDVSEILRMEYPFTCALRKDELISCLTRANIFADPFENNGVYLEFKNNSVTVKDTKNNFYEELVLSTLLSDEYTIFVNAQLFLDLLAGQPGDTVTINYGNEYAIKLDSEHIIQILSQMGE